MGGAQDREKNRARDKAVVTTASRRPVRDADAVADVDADCALDLHARKKNGGGRSVGQFAVNVGQRRAPRTEIRIINMAEVKSSTVYD